MLLLVMLSNGQHMCPRRVSSHTHQQASAGCHAARALLRVNVGLVSSCTGARRGTLLVCALQAKGLNKGTSQHWGTLRWGHTCLDMICNTAAVTSMNGGIIHVCIHQHTLQRLPQLLIESSLLADTKLRGLNEAMGQALQCVLASYR